MAADLLLLRFVLLLLLLLAVSMVPPASSASSSAGKNNSSVSIDSATLSFSDLTLLGDAFLRNGSVGLTRDTGVPSSSAGTVLCSRPVALRGSANATASFAARFSFVVANQNAGSTGGDGIAFFISSDRATLGATGGYLGLFNSSIAAAAVPSDDDADAVGPAIVAVEFDTMVNVELGDPSDNHVGLDLGSPASVSAVDLADSGIVLKSGNLTTAWIDYRGAEHLLEVSLSYSGVKPKRPVFCVAVDLSPYLKEAMYVGFSASTEGSTQQHTIKEWTFQTFGLPPATNASSFTNATSNVSEPAVSSVAASSGDTSKKRFGRAITILGPVALAVAFMFFACVSVKKLAELTSRKDAIFLPGLLKGPRKFNHKELSVATRGFHASRVIGRGAFGTVYKAAMPGAATTYAVKRSTQAHQSRSEFVAELSVIACLRHKNLVQLEGWCDEKGELLLVYEYMPNGSLDKALYGDPCTLSWPERHNVAAGIASVLSYLHQECEQRVIHRDIKTGNILLDGNLSPRLGDFGLARLMDHNKNNVNLVDWVWRLHGEDRLIEAADARLNGEFDREGMLRLLLVGLSCANPNCEERPAMRRVVQILNREADPVPVPRKKPLLVFSSSASSKLQEMAFSCGDDVRGCYPAATTTNPASPKSEGADRER
ncbi:unnamed protein product [Triticum turgidum subsp. durum]|uniref:non-specific serine/threonine protein kinase n=1 Tax=Triticum turgidum subsp. durum TaxID=4567 RepID=A0A9R0ZAR2_TRITD|nr:unnamed protein product [Triticum turgidum subsp. durum]